jgi:hypothetical protein
MLSYENETMDSFGFTQEQKDNIAKHKKKEFKLIKKQIKKARENGDHHYIVDKEVSLSVLLKLDKAGFYVRSVPNPGQDYLFNRAPHIMTSAWAIFW